MTTKRENEGYWDLNNDGDVATGKNQMGCAEKIKEGWCGGNPYLKGMRWENTKWMARGYWKGENQQRWYKEKYLGVESISTCRQERGGTLEVHLYILLA